MKDIVENKETLLSSMVMPVVINSPDVYKRANNKKRVIGLRVYDEHKRYIQKSKINLTYFLQKCTEQLYLELVNRNNMSAKTKEIKE